MQLTALSKACHGSCSAPMDPDKRKFEKWLPVFTVTLRFLRAAKLGTQIWRIMKLTTIILFTACCTASATGYSQITLSEKNAPLKKVFKKIEQQSGFHFLYPSNAVDKAGTVTIDVSNVNIEQALKAVLKGKELTYVISGETVVIKESEKQLSEQQNSPPPSIDIRGRVVNDKGEPVDGVTVTVKGTKKATFTNASGEFILKGIDGGATLVFTGVQIETYELAVNNRTEIAVHLKPKLMSMEDVAVIASTGYQTISKERATGAFDVVDRKTLDKRPVSDLSTALQGMVAGLQAKENVDGTMNFLLRGAGSMYGATAPLIVIDGFPVTGNDFSNINPNDVETVTVLKDAAAASIWGSRAANGVIVVTTKRPKGREKVSVEVNAFTRVSNKINLNQVMNVASSADQIAYERLAYQRELWSGGGYVPGFASVSNPITLAQEILFGNRTGAISTDQMNYSLDSLAGIDNRGELRDNFLRNGLINQATVNLSGATDRMKTYGSLLYEGKKDGIVKRGYERYLLNFNNQLDATRYLQFSFGANLQYKKTETSGPAIEEMQGLSPYETLVDPDGNYSVNVNTYSRQEINKLPLNQFPYSDWSYNLLREVRGRKFTNEQISARVQGGIKLTLVKGIDIDAKAQYEKIKTESSNYYNEETFFVRNLVNRYVAYNNSTRTVSTQYLPKGGILQSSDNNLESYVLRGQLNVNRTIARDFNLAGVAGAEISSYLTTSTTNPTVYGYFADKNQSTVPPYGYGSSVDRFVTFNGFSVSALPGGNTVFGWGKDKYVSFYSNTAINYRNKYTLSGSARSDASNFITHDPKLRWSPLWSVGGMWKMSDEQFMHRISFVDQLALRLTYGENGTAVKASSTRPLLNVGTSPDPNTGTIISSISDNGNPTLRWERTQTSNVGIDFSIFKRKLFGKIDYYNRLGKDITGQISLPATTGTTLQIFNNAAIINRGVELELNANVKIGRLQWNPMVTYAYNYNRVKSLYYPSLLVRDLVSNFGSARQVEARPLNPVYSFTYLGMKDSVPYIAGPKGTPVPINSSLTVQPGDFLNYHGTTIPPHTLGFVNTFSGFGFDLMVVITGKFGGVYRNPIFPYQASLATQGIKLFVPRTVADVLANDPRVPEFPKYRDVVGSSSWYFISNFLNTMVESSSFVECKEINLQYTLPARWIKSLQLNGLRAFTQVRDLGMIWHANSRGFNPEWLPGTQRPVTSYTFGFNAKF